MSFVDEHSQMVEVGGRAARVYEAGDGDVTVVVLHGWGGRIESMAPVLRGLKNARVIAVDLPGFGESPIPDSVWGTPEYARFLTELFERIGVSRAHFLGHSFGGKISTYLAAKEPQLVDRLVLAGSSGLRTPPSMKARFKRALSKMARRAGAFGAPGKRLQRAIYERVASSDYKQAGELRPILVKVVNENLHDLLPEVKVPTLLVWGSEDDAVPMSHARTFEDRIPDAGLVVFEGAGHFAYLDEAPRFCTIVNNFFGLAT